MKFQPIFAAGHHRSQYFNDRRSIYQLSKDRDSALPTLGL
jgi:hypothetical protein